MSRDLNNGGKLFDTDRPQTAKLLSPYVVLVRVTESCERLVAHK